MIESTRRTLPAVIVILITTPDVTPVAFLTGVPD